MTLTVWLRGEAEQDIEDAARWYEDRQPGLGAQFLDEAARTLDAIAEQPTLHSVIHRDTRRALLHRFPFGIYYRLQQAGIVVVAVMHGSRHPQRWKSRE